MANSQNARTALLIAFHYPPFAGSSGAHRTIALARHLAEYGWNPIVLTAGACAYENRVDISDSGADPHVPVWKAPALDTARHLAIRGRYPRFLALPDRWVSWTACAVPTGLALVARYRPQVMWTTYPLATSHLIGWTLNRLTRLPWIADFRDPMVEYISNTWYPRDDQTRRCRLAIERRVARQATAVTFCTSTARDIFLDRHGAKSHAASCQVIANGFDEDDFESARRLPSRRDSSRVHLVHSGTLYPGQDRDPSAFLEAIAALRLRGRLPPALQVTFRASGFDDAYRPVIRRLQLEDVVRLAPAVPYHEALREILDADGLLLFQGETSNPAIPAKAYEYLRARRPIFAVLHDTGETAGLLRDLGVGTIVRFGRAEDIAVGLHAFLKGIAACSIPVLNHSETSRFSRRLRVAEFAALMDTVAKRRIGKTHQ